jgi:hypothetical protein
MMSDMDEGDEKVEGVLSGCGLSRHADSFRRERITWDALMELEEADLTSLGLTLGLALAHAVPAHPPPSSFLAVFLAGPCSARTPPSTP